MGDCFKMVRVHAMSCAAQMVKLLAFRDIAFEELVKEAMHSFPYATNSE